MTIKPGSIAQRALEYLRARPGEHLMSKAATDLNCSVASVSSAFYELKREGLTDFRKRGDHVRAPLAWWATPFDYGDDAPQPKMADGSPADPKHYGTFIVDANIPSPINGHRVDVDLSAVKGLWPKSITLEAKRGAEEAQNSRASAAVAAVARTIGAHDDPVPRFAMWSSLRLAIVLSDGTKATLTRGDTRALLSFIAGLSREVIEAAQDEAP